MVIGEKVRPNPCLPTSDSSGETAPGDPRFRRDIQGLRAVAVVLVVLFHADVPGLGGGYVGVDVFFVISGFVITQVLLREHASTGSTSLLRFWVLRGPHCHSGGYARHHRHRDRALRRSRSAGWQPGGQ